MNLGDLIDRLTEVAEMEGCSRDMPVTFGTDRTPVEGGLIGTLPGGDREVNLTPVSFDGRPFAF